MTQEEIKDKLTKANEEYRLSGDSPLTDVEFDFLMNQVEDEEFKKSIGIKLTKKAKVKLPIQMGSLEKIKTVEELDKWVDKKHLDSKKVVNVTPKYDGLSLLVEFVEGDFVKAYTRGDGTEGQDVTRHFAHTKLGSVDTGFTGFIVGEAIMKEAVFKEKYSKRYKNPRNMVAGVLNRKSIREESKDICFIAYDVPTGIDECTLTFLNDVINEELWDYRVPHAEFSISELCKEKMDESMRHIDTFQCDGLVIKIRDEEYQKEIGYETNSLNPAFARAWKPESDDSKVTTVKGIRWQVSKQGLQKPVVEIEPVDIAGVTISNVTGNNAKYIEENGIQEGTLVTIIRSGDVIPKIIGVTPVTEFKGLISECVCCDNKLKWSKTNTELVCDDTDCEDQIISRNVSFFEIMGIDIIREGTITTLLESGYTTLDEICNMTIDDFEELDGFKRSKAKNCYNAIHTKLNVDLEKYQHATSLFDGLGSRKLALLTEYNSINKIPEMEDILKINGFSDTSAYAYLEGIEVFWDLVECLPFMINETRLITEGKLIGKAFVFTGYRNKALEEQIKNLGGKISSSVSKNTAYLVVKQKDSGSGKETKALSLNVTIIEGADCERMIADL